MIENEDLGYDQNGEKILGKYQPKTNTAFIDRMLKQTNDPRRIFTCWHEVGGHGILQGEWLRSRVFADGALDSIVTTSSTLSPNVEDKLEVQANIFAGLAAAPAWLVDHTILRTFRLTRPYRYVGPRTYSFCAFDTTLSRNVRSFEEFCWHIAYQIQRWFGGLSAEALGYRVAESRWVFDATANRITPHGFSLHRIARPQTSTSHGGNRLQVEFSNLVSESMSR